MQNTNSLLLATRFKGKPRLHSCYPLGKVEEKAWTSIGSGSDYALGHISNYVSSHALDVPRDISLEKGVELAHEGLSKASQDLYTGGLDLVVVTPRGIKNYGSMIRKDISDAEQKAVRKVKRLVR